MAGEEQNIKRGKPTGRPIGPTGETVRENIRRIRDKKGMSQNELSKKLGSLGRPIPPLGIHRIENGDRRVDVDDLVSLAAALGISPAGLLMPAFYENESPVDALDFVSVTGFVEPVMALSLWNWITGADALGENVNEFIQHTWPFWDRVAWEGRLEAERENMVKLRRDVTDGDD